MSSLLPRLTPPQLPCPSPSLLRTKALVLELLAAVCLVRGGHDIILAAFDNFKEVLDFPTQHPCLPLPPPHILLELLGVWLSEIVASSDRACGDTGWMFGKYTGYWDEEIQNVRYS